MTCRPPCTEHHGPPLGRTQAAWAVGAPPALPGGGVLAPSAASQAGPAASRTSCPRGPAHLLLRLPQADTSSSFGSVWGLRLRRPHRPAAGWCPAAASGLPGRRPGRRSADSRRGRLSGSTGAGGCAVAASIPSAAGGRAGHAASLRRGRSPLRGPRAPCRWSWCRKGTLHARLSGPGWAPRGQASHKCSSCLFPDSSARR